MPSAGQDFAEFVATRGPALWRTASLLEPNPADAEQALVTALAYVRRRWRDLSRDGTAERVVRERLYRVVAAHTPATGEPDDLVAPARIALLSLSNIQRHVLVITNYEGLSASEAASVLGLDADDVTRTRATATSAMLEQAGGARDTRMMALLDAAALRDVPQDLAERAASAPRGRSHRTMIVVAASVTAIAGLMALAPWAGDSDAQGSTNVDEWGIPRELPVATGLPTLVDAPVEAASTAYVVDGIPVVTDATTGAASVVFDGDPTPDWYDEGGPGQSASAQRLIDVEWSQAVLSPDGVWLVLVQAITPAGGDVTSKTFLVHLPTATPTFIGDVATAPYAVGPGRITRPRISWDPRSEGFACVCAGTLSIVDVRFEDGKPVVNVSHTPINTNAVAGGLPGLAVRERGRGWWIINRPSAVTDPISNATALAMTGYERVLYLTADVTAIYALGSDREVDGGRCILWNSTFSEPIAIEPFRERDGGLCTPLAMHASRDGFVLILRSNTPLTESDPVDIVIVEPDATTHAVGAFPPRTSAASVASLLVG